MSWLPRRRALWGLAVAVGVAACAGGDVVVPEAGDPFLYLLLNERVPNLSPEQGQHALLVTVESVLESPVFRAAERFEMRSADGSLFDWVQHDHTGDIGSYPFLNIQRGNFFLRNSPQGGRLGAADLEPGASYSLLVETGGTTMRGTATIPDTFSVRLAEQDDRSHLFWSPPAGAAGYRIEIPDREVLVQTDTVFTVPPGISPSEVTVVAVETNFFQYSIDPRLPRAGIDSGLGLFGALMPGTRRY